jgi:hypothetical protein
MAADQNSDRPMGTDKLFLAINRRKSTGMGVHGLLHLIKTLFLAVARRSFPAAGALASSRGRRIHTEGAKMAI